MQREELLFETLGEHEERLVRIEGKLDNHEERLGRIERKLDNHEGRLIRIEDKIDRVEIDVERIKNTMTTKDDLRELERRLLVGADKQIALLTAIQDDQTAAHHALLRHENKLAEQGEQIEQLQLDVTRLKPQTNIA